MTVEENMRLANKLAIITAAASGMGRAGVALFLREGAKVCAIDINPEALAALKAELDPAGDRLHTVQADLSQPEGARDSIHQAAAKLGGVDILWAHAGIPGPGGIENLDVAEYQQAFALNVQSAAFGAGEVITQMRKRGAGSIIFTASVSGMVGSMWSPVYSSCKFAVVGLTKSLAQTFAPDKVRVNVVCPGSGRDADEDRLHRTRRVCRTGQGCRRPLSVGGTARAPGASGRGRARRAVAGVRRCGFRHRYRASDRRGIYLPVTAGRRRMPQGVPVNAPMRQAAARAARLRLFVRDNEWGMT
jgi:NAD(P)-dependent dehydrogenase (short-subunit alcohol dehydrogenase family)